MTDYQLEFGIPRGPQGPQGPIGATGPAGPRGPVGPQGPAGDNGAPPIFGLPVTGDPGSAVTITGSGTSADPLILTVPRGETGAAGPQGPTGPTGQQGPKGDKGDKGDAGPAGEQGPVGPAAATTFTDIPVKIGRVSPDTSASTINTSLPTCSPAATYNMAGAASYGAGGTLTPEAPGQFSTETGGTKKYKVKMFTFTQGFLAFLNTAKGSRSQVTVHCTLAAAGPSPYYTVLSKQSGVANTIWTWDGTTLKADKGQSVYISGTSTVDLCVMGTLTVS